MIWDINFALIVIAAFMGYCFGYWKGNGESK